MTPEEAYYKAVQYKISGIRSPELEDIIMTDYKFAYRYAQHVIKGRCIEAEDIIMNDPIHSYYYSKYVIKGKLPEKMHNMMLLYAIKNPDDPYPRWYFRLINDTR